MTVAENLNQFGFSPIKPSTFAQWIDEVSMDFNAFVVKSNVNEDREAFYYFLRQALNVEDGEKIPAMFTADWELWLETFYKVNEDAKDLAATQQAALGTLY